MLLLPYWLLWPNLHACSAHQIQRVLKQYDQNRKPRQESVLSHSIYNLERKFSDLLITLHNEQCTLLFLSTFKLATIDEIQNYVYT